MMSGLTTKDLDWSECLSTRYIYPIIPAFLMMNTASYVYTYHYVDRIGSMSLPDGIMNSIRCANQKNAETPASLYALHGIDVYVY